MVVDVHIDGIMVVNVHIDGIMIIISSIIDVVNGHVVICCGDICDDEFMLNIFEKEHPEWVCHMAAHASVCPSIQDHHHHWWIHINLLFRR